jgi:hypothetical protein
MLGFCIFLLNFYTPETAVTGVSRGIIRNIGGSSAGISAVTLYSQPTKL